MLYIMSDIHSDIRRFKKLIRKAQKRYGCGPGAGDTVLVLGDLLTPLHVNNRYRPGGVADDARFLGWLARQQFDVVSIRGNRESAAFLAKFHPEDDTAYSGPVQRVSSNVAYLEDNCVYSFPLETGEVISVLVLGGALSHATRFRRPGKFRAASFKARYLPTITAPTPVKVDIVASHDAPISQMGILRPLFGATVVNRELEKAMGNIEFTQWLFGHHHLDITRHGRFACLYRRALLVEKRSSIPWNLHGIWPRHVEADVPLGILAERR